jgi:hypothetical protein
MDPVLKGGEKTGIICMGTGEELLGALLKVHSAIKAIDEKAHNTAQYKGSRLGTPDGETRIVGKALPRDAGPVFAHIVKNLYKLREKGYLGEKELKAIETRLSRNIQLHDPVPKLSSARRGAPPNRALNLLVYLLYENVKPRGHLHQYDLMGGFLAEQDAIGTESLSPRALYNRYLRVKGTHPARWYRSLRDKNPQLSLPEWESLFSLINKHKR